MSINDRINQILATRHPIAENIQIVKNNLNSLSSSLKNIEEQKNLLKDKLTNKEDTSIVLKLNNMDFSQYQVRIFELLKSLDRVTMRFNRKTLNIAVVANAKQGKSRLLRSLTTLSENEIPDGNQGHCTGIASTVRPNQNGNDIYAEVWFHTPESFLNQVIAPYYETLELGAMPYNLSEFQKSLPILTSKFANHTNTIYQEMYRYLGRYHKHFREYQHLLGKTGSQPEKIKSSDIRKYVAQYNLEGTATYHYMAVQKCHIFCPFPNAPTDKIAVVDTQGLGDTGVGDKERLIEVLGENVDIILFVKMPKPAADYWGTSDIELYSVANQALADYLPLEKWSFFVLNNTTDSKIGDNTKQCHVLTEQVPATINVADDIIIANCADENQARDFVLQPIVSYLVNNIEYLDREYSVSYQREINELHNQIIGKLKQANDSLVVQTKEQNSSRVFEKVFKKFWQKLTIKLDRLIENLKHQSKAEDDFFQERVDMVIEIAENDTGIPSDGLDGDTAIEQMEEAIINYTDPEMAYSAYLNKVRTKLTRHFYALDDGLNLAIEQAKIEVANLFVEELGFSNLTDKRGFEFIQEMSQILPQDSSSQIREAFKVFAEYKLSFKGLILPRIRPCLEPLQAFPRAVSLTAKERLDAAEQILGNIQALHGEAIFQCKDVLENMLTEPVQAALAIVEEFQDQVILSEDIEIEWRLFLPRGGEKALFFRAKMNRRAATRSKKEEGRGKKVSLLVFGE